MAESGEESFQKVIRQESWVGSRNIFIEEVILSVVWGILSQVLPEGSLMAVMNVAFLLLSLTLAWAMSETLRLRLSSLVSGAISGILWVLLFGVLRGLF